MPLDQPPPCIWDLVCVMVEHHAQACLSDIGILFTRQLVSCSYLGVWFKFIESAGSSISMLQRTNIMETQAVLQERMLMCVNIMSADAAHVPSGEALCGTACCMHACGLFNLFRASCEIMFLN